MTPHDVISGIEFLSDQYGGTFKLNGNDADRIIAALSAAGFVIVPREPTEAMRNAGYQFYCANKDGYTAWRHHLDVYRAMLSAAEGKPSPSQRTETANDPR